MGIWAGIKYALNSTLGTQNFKSLDQIIRDSYYIYASDNLLKTLYDVDYGQNTYNIPLTDIGTINLSGSVRLTFTVSGASLNDDGYARVIFAKNGSDEKQMYFPNATGGTVTIDVNVNKGDVLQFRFSGTTTYQGYAKSIKIIANGSIGSAPDTGIFID